MFVDFVIIYAYMSSAILSRSRFPYLNLGSMSLAIQGV